jgi:AcrR family transcriptional regulator
VSATVLAAGPDVDAIGERILDAAVEEFRHHGLRRTSLDDVARRAGVARITVYRRFASKNGLLQATVLREAQQFPAELDSAMAGLDRLDDQVAEAFLLTIRAGERHPLLQGVLAVEPESFLPAVTTNGGPLLAAASGYLVDRLGIDPAAAEVLARIVQSFALTPASVIDLEDDDAVRTFAREHLTPLARS